MDRTSKLSQKRSMHLSAVNEQKDSPISVQYKDGLAPKGLADHQVTASQATSDAMELRSKGEEIRRYCCLYNVYYCANLTPILMH